MAYVIAEALAALPSRAAATAAPPRPPLLPPTDRAGVIVVVPTYHEAESLPLFVERFAATGLELLIVDDASPDGTGALADELAAHRPWMHVLHREGKDGLGVAYRAGFSWCLDPRLPRGRSDGLRPVAPAGEDRRDAGCARRPRRRPRHRQPLPARRRHDELEPLAPRPQPRRLHDEPPAARPPLRRPRGGFKLWRASCLEDLGLDGMLAAGYAFQIETTQVAHLLGKRIEEIPFTFCERVAGESKMSLAISLEGIGVCLRLRRQTRERYAPCVTRP